MEDIDKYIDRLTKSSLAISEKYGHGVEHVFCSEAHRLYVRKWEGNDCFAHSVHYMDNCVYLSRSKCGKDFIPDLSRANLSLIKLLSHVSHHNSLNEKKLGDKNILEGSIFDN